MAKKRIAILGATGSIGQNTLDVLSGSRDDFEVVLLSANKNREKLNELAANYPGAKLILAADGEQKFLDAIGEAHADIVVNGIVGAAGLKPSLAAIESGATLALANKETVVMAGSLLFKRASEKNSVIIPVDSEHSAIFHLLDAHSSGNLEPQPNPTAREWAGEGSPLENIILTASGGPFRHFSDIDLEYVSPTAALAHPNWSMGPKITVDSATLANKGLEVIEAVRFFKLPPEKVKVVIHPQSIVHAMLQLTDGTVYAAMSRPDMRLPIKQALHWPQLVPGNFGRLDFDSLTIEFLKPNTKKFPMLPLAYAAIQKDGFYPCVYNSANEVAVAAFLESRIGFLDISRVVENVMNNDWDGKPDTIDAVLEIHRRAAEMAETRIKGMKR